MSRINYYEVLYGLLHDIGKPMLRYKMRVGEGLEKYDEELMRYLRGVRDHEDARDAVLKEILRLDPNLYKRYEERILQADMIAAVERGLEAWYSRVREIWAEVELGLSEKVGVVYEHHKAPMLSPLWLLLKTNYKDSLGPCAKTTFDADSAWSHISNELKPLIELLKNGDPEKISDELAKFFKTLMDEPVWYPIVLLDSKTLASIKAYKYLDSLSYISYYSITKYLVDTLRLLKDVYGSNLGTRGLVNTLLEAFKYSLLTVPSAVYLALVPDISLYSHAKLVSAYTAVLSSGYNAFRLMLLDARGIQDFISAPVKAKAASRVIRGRSLITELVTTSLANYVLELYGGLPNTNVISSEGGSLMLVVPYVDEEDKIIKVFEEVIRDTYDRLKGLWFTVAYSKPFTSLDVRRLGGFTGDKDETSFMNVLKSLEDELAEKKSLDNAKMKFNIDESSIIGFDAITLEPVPASEVGEGFYGLEVSEDYLDYTNKISGFKLMPGEIVSEATHLSLVAGTCSRNMIYLISVHVYEGRREDTLRPNNTLITKLTEELAKELSSEDKSVRAFQKRRLVYELRETVNDSTYELLTGLLPLPSLGSLHIIVSVRDVISGDYVNVSSTLIKKVLAKLHEALSRITPGIGDRIHFRIDLKIVNVGSEFVEALNSEDLRNYVSAFLKEGIDVSLGVLHAGTYHPYEVCADMTLTLVDLDAYPLIGLAKIDGDELGEVKKLVSSSPSRLATFSDLLTVLLSIKTHLLSSEYSVKFGFVNRGPIMLYAGGDDIAFYGYWVDVISFLYEVYEKVVRALYPLSFSSAIVVDVGDYPILEFYEKVVNLLRGVKAEGRGGLAVYPFASPRMVKCGEVCKIVRSVSIWSEQAGWPRPLTDLATLEGMMSVLRGVDLAKLSEYKREIQLLSTVSALSDGELRALCGSDDQTDSLYQLIRREVMYSYVSRMHESELKLLGEVIKHPEVMYHAAGEDVRQCVMRLVDAKVALDLILAYLRIGSGVKSATGI